MSDVSRIVVPNKLTKSLIQYCVLFQTNRNIFPFPSSREKNALVYNIARGIDYLKFCVMKKNTKSSPYFLTVSYLYVSKGIPRFVDDTLLTAQIPPKVYEEIVNDPSAPELLKEVLTAIPQEKDEYPYIEYDKYFPIGYYKDFIQKLKEYLEEFSVPEE